MWITSCFHRDARLKTRCSGGLASQETSIAVEICDGFPVSMLQIVLASLISRKTFQNQKIIPKTSELNLETGILIMIQLHFFSWTPLEKQKKLTPPPIHENVKALLGCFHWILWPCHQRCYSGDQQADDTSTEMTTERTLAPAPGQDSLKLPGLFFSMVHSPWKKL